MEISPQSERFLWKSSVPVVARAFGRVTVARGSALGPAGISLGNNARFLTATVSLAAMRFDLGGHQPSIAPYLARTSDARSPVEKSFAPTAVSASRLDAAAASAHVLALGWDSRAHTQSRSGLLGSTLLAMSGSRLASGKRPGPAGKYSTALSWRSIWVALCARMNRCITRTATGPTTGLRTWSCVSGTTVTARRLPIAAPALASTEEVD